MKRFEINICLPFSYFNLDIMIRFLLIMFFLQFQFTAIAQQKAFVINGEVKGLQNFKYAYLFDNNYNQIGKQNIVNGLFLFSGKYLPEQLDDHGEIGIGILLLSNLEVIASEDALDPGKPYVVTVIMEPRINITYLTASNKFSIRSGKLNEIQNLFNDNAYLFKTRSDSAFLVIDKQVKDGFEKTKEKKRITRALYYQRKLIDLEIIKKNKNSRVALFNFADFAINPIISLDESKALFESFPDSLKSSKYGIDVLNLLNAQEQYGKPILKIADSMPVFSLNDINRKLIKSTDVLEKYTLIDFWASWCAPCIAENPNLKLAYQTYHKKGFNIISISIDTEKDREKWLAAIKKDETQEFINLFNPGGTSGIAKNLGINAIPANYLVDKNGTIVGINLRGNDLQKKLSELLSK